MVLLIRFTIKINWRSTITYVYIFLYCMHTDYIFPVSITSFIYNW